MIEYEMMRIGLAFYYGVCLRIVGRICRDGAGTTWYDLV